MEGLLYLGKRVGMVRFELTTLASRKRCATKLRYIPLVKIILTHRKHYNSQALSLQFSSNSAMETTLMVKVLGLI